MSQWKKYLIYVSNMVLFLFDGVVSKAGTAEYHEADDEFYYSEKEKCVL